VGYLLLADGDTFVCRSWDDLAARLVWAQEQGYAMAKLHVRLRSYRRPATDAAATV
jgi:hypothetical protein